MSELCSNMSEEFNQELLYLIEVIVETEGSVICV